MRGWNQFNRTKAGRDDHQAPSLLRDSVIGAVDDALFGIFAEMKSFVGKGFEEISEDGMPLKFWNIFHGHDVGPQLANEPSEFAEQCPFRVFFVLVPLCVFGERHAWRAADENWGVSIAVWLGNLAA